MKKLCVLKKIVLILFVMALLNSCEKKSNNGAKEYSGDNSKVLQTGFYSEKHDIPDDIFSLNSMKTLSNKLYYTSLVKKLDKTLYIYNKENDTFLDMSLSEKNQYIDNAFVLGEDIYISFSDDYGKKFVANIDINGNIENQMTCENGEYIIKWSEDYFGDVHIKEFSELYAETFITLYDKNFSEKESINLSEKLCNDNEVIVSLFIDEFRNLWVQKAYDVISEKNFKMKIVKYDRDTFDELLTIDYSQQIGNIEEFTAGEFLWIVSADENIKYINKHDISTGEIIDMYELEEISNVTESHEYDFLYTYNENVYGYKDDKKILISNYDPYKIATYETCNKYDFIIGYCNTSSLAVIEKNINNDDFLRYDIEIPLESYVNEAFSVKDDKLCFYVYDISEDKHVIVWYDTLKNEQKYYYPDISSESIVTDIEIINSEQIFIVIKDDTDYKNVLYNIQTGEITDKIKSEYIKLFCTDSNDIAMITYDEKEKYCFYVLDKDSDFVFKDKLELNYSFEEINISNGFEEYMFFINTPEGISGYGKFDNKLNYIMNTSNLVTGCSADIVVPLNSQHCMVYGLNHMSYEFDLMSVKSKNDTKLNTLKIALIGQTDAQIDNAISYFNKNNPDIQIIKSEFETNIEESYDVFIYDDSFNDNAYRDNLLFCDIKDYLLNDINQNEYFSFAFQGSGSDFKVIPSFGICDYTNDFSNDELILSDDELIEKFILYKLDRYKDNESGLYNFHNEEFYKNLRMIKERESVGLEEIFITYGNSSDFNEETLLSDDFVIVPQYYISVLDNERKGYSAEFIKYLLSDECQSIKTGERSKGLPVKKIKFEELLNMTNISENNVKSLESKIDHSTCVVYDKNVVEIVYNEVVDYIGGRFDEKLVADNIESKLRLNFSERE